MPIIGYKSVISQFLVTHLLYNFLSNTKKACFYANFMGTLNKIQLKIGFKASNKFPGKFLV